MWLLAKPILSGAWAFLRGLPWQLWAGLALLALGLFYGHLRYNAGQADIQTKFDAYQSRMIAATDAAKAAAKRAETLSRTAMDAALLARTKGKTDAKSKGAAVTSGVKSGSVRLQDHWACKPGLPDPQTIPASVMKAPTYEQKARAELLNSAPTPTLK